MRRYRVTFLAEDGARRYSDEFESDRPRTEVEAELRDVVHGLAHDWIFGYELEILN